MDIPSPDRPESADVESADGPGSAGQALGGRSQWLMTSAGERVVFDVASPFVYRVKADSSDMDAQGHVNNAVYVRWMDAAALAHSQAVGYGWSDYRALGASFVVRRHEVDYLASARAGQTIVVATWPCQMKRFTAWRRHQIVRLEDGQTLVRALTKWVFVDLVSGRPKRMPEALIRSFRPRDES